MDKLLSDADAARTAGQTDSAVKILDRAALIDPTSKEPWLRKAQWQFDDMNYAQASASAQEVVQRDPGDQTANSILTVSGLRISTQALARLRNQSGLSGNVRSEAETLARTLRESLGEDVLVPTASSSSSTPARRSAPPPPAKTASAPRKPLTMPDVPNVDTSQLPSTPSLPSTPDTSDPFSILKK